jgi:16S rRNA (guanine527-N7)-methyltransferase
VSQQDALALLAEGALVLGVTLDPSQLDQFARYLAELRKWNRKMNLTGAHDEREIVTQHFLDSLAGSHVLRDLPAVAEVADLGSGAGFPGLPLKIAYPGLRLTLIEPRQKRAAFLLTLCGVLGISGVQVVSETVSPERPAPADLAGRYLRVLARAVADPIEVLRLARPLLCRGGQAAVWVSTWQADQFGEEYERVVYTIPGTTIFRTLLIVPA